MLETARVDSSFILSSVSTVKKIEKKGSDASALRLGSALDIVKKIKNKHKISDTRIEERYGSFFYIVRKRRSRKLWRDWKLPVTFYSFVLFCEIVPFVLPPDE